MKQHRSCILEKPPEPLSRGRRDCGSNIQGLQIIEPVVSSICRPPNPFIMDPQVASKPRVCPQMRKQDFSSLFAMHFQPNPVPCVGAMGILLLSGEFLPVNCQHAWFISIFTDMFLLMITVQEIKQSQMSCIAGTLKSVFVFVLWRLTIM